MIVARQIGLGAAGQITKIEPREHWARLNHRYSQGSYCEEVLHVVNEQV